MVGAVAGGIFGSQVSGNGARTEGSVLGAVLGGGLGAAIADDRRNCQTENRTTIIQGSQRAITGATHTNGRSIASNTGTFNTRSSNIGVNRGSVNTGSYGQAAYQGARIQTINYPSSNSRFDRRLNQIERQIGELRFELKTLRKRQNFRYDPYINRRINSVSYNLETLKLRKRTLIKEAGRSNRRNQGRNFY